MQDSVASAACYQGNEHISRRASHLMREPLSMTMTPSTCIVGW